MRSDRSGPVAATEAARPSSGAVRVPFIDLPAQYAALRAEIDGAVREVMESGQFVLGPAVDRFERAFASYIGVSGCAAVNSGTAALHLGLMALGLERGDEVLIPTNTFFATAEAVIWAGGRPVLVDVVEEDATIDPALAAEAITPATRAIIPVDLYGQPARYDEILELAKRKNLLVLEDACQAHGAAYRKHKAGTFGAAAAFSFYPGKNLGAAGEGGALLSDDPEIVRRVKALRDHGQVAKYDHAIVGHNFRLEALQGAVLAAKLPRLEAWNEARRRAAGWYREALAGLPMVLPVERPEARHVYHLFVVRVRDRDAFREHLAGRGIETLVHYPIPLHKQRALAGFAGPKAEFPVSDRLAAEIVSLPLFPEITQAQVEQVAAAAAAFFRAGGGGR